MKCLKDRNEYFIYLIAIVRIIIITSWHQCTIWYNCDLYSRLSLSCHRFSLSSQTQMSIRGQANHTNVKKGWPRWGVHITGSGRNWWVTWELMVCQKGHRQQLLGNMDPVLLDLLIFKMSVEILTFMGNLLFLKGGYIVQPQQEMYDTFKMGSQQRNCLKSVAGFPSPIKEWWNHWGQ